MRKKQEEYAASATSLCQATTARHKHVNNNIWKNYIFAGLYFISVNVVRYQESLETKESILLVSDSKMYLRFDIP